MSKRKFFRHYSDGRKDNKLAELRMEHGPAGYGVYFMLLEKLREEPDYKGQLKASYIRALAFDFHAEANLIRSVICDFGLFDTDAETGTFESPRFTEQMHEIEAISKSRKSAAAKRWSRETDANASENECKCNANAMQMHQKTDANASENECKCNANASEKVCICIGQQREKNQKRNYIHIAPDKHDDIDDLTEGRNEGRKEEDEFLMPDETPESQSLKTRLQSIDWPQDDIGEFMRYADYGEDRQTRAIQLLERFEVDRLKYEPTQFTPRNIMSWLRTEESRGTLVPRTTRKEIALLKDLRRRDIAGSVKNQVRAWLEGAPDRQQRTDRAERMAAALKDIDRGRINRPDAFLVATMKKA